ncbi:MAG TPA: DUF6036 family nucleotidyltransferase [Candidatus Saccharimonadales bacterium]|nr:DUF6036 family nucleotidyltransferase [Candidatus Saccharimonadales bacterium]
MTANQEKFLTRGRAIEALTRLGGQLVAAGVVGDVYLVGGGAMVLAYDADRMTRDIDAVFAPTAEIYKAAQIVGDDLRLPHGWLNDAAKGFVPGADPGATKVLDVPGIRVTAASPEFLLGMKLLAARPEQDRADIAHLARLLDLKTRDEVLAVAEGLYPPDLLLPRTRFLVEEMFPAEREPIGVDKPDPPAAMRP